jgi:three-Cys-motif partner protein
MSATDSSYAGREQSEIKHYALRLYLEAATRILGSSRNLKYVDVCAGPWQSQAKDLSDTSFGVALKALAESADDLGKRAITPQLACLLIEKDQVAFQLLDAFARSKDTASLRVHARNWDFTARIADIVRYCSRADTFPFIFIDPKGWQLAGISKIRALLRLEPGEVLINLMLPFIGRFLKDGKTDFSDLLGEDFPELRQLSGTDLEFAIVRKYSEIVKSVGQYAYVCSLPVMNPDMDTFNFHLIYATRHAKGVKVFKDVERRTEEMTHVVRAEVQQRERQAKTNNFELFKPNVRYKENRYQQLSRENKQRARTSVWRLLSMESATPYDRCWAEALQYSAVYEVDLRSWLSVWRSDGLIEIFGMAPKTRVPQFGQDIMIILKFKQEE